MAAGGSDGEVEGGVYLTWVSQKKKREQAFSLKKDFLSLSGTPGQTQTRQLQQQTHTAFNAARFTMSSRPRRSTRRTESAPKDEDKKDDRGAKFGTGIVFDDVYSGVAGAVATGGDDADDFVNELPTEDEERRLRADDNDVRLKEQMEELDEGRASNHPATLAAAAASAGNNGTQVGHHENEV